MMRWSRVSLVQYQQGSWSVMLLHAEQYVTRSLTRRMASARRSIASRGVLRTWNARRCAVLAPTPGRRCSSSTSLARGSVRLDKGRLSIQSRSESGNLEPGRQHAAHLLLHLLVDLPVRVVDGREDQVLQHLDIVFRHRFGIDREALHALAAVHDNGDHAAAGRGFDARFGHLLREALLHLLR